MRRLIAFLLVITYMASAIGFSYSLHYCGGHYRYVCFTSDTEKDCCGKNEHKRNCCKDKIIKAKFTDNHNLSFKSALNEVSIDYDLPVNFAYSVIQPASEQNVRIDDLNLPPPLTSDVPLYLLYRVIRI